MKLHRRDDRICANKISSEFDFVPSVKKLNMHLLETRSPVNVPEIKAHYIKLVKQSIAQRAIFCQTQVVANTAIYSGQAWPAFMVEV